MTTGTTEQRAQRSPTAILRGKYNVIKMTALPLWTYPSEASILQIFRVCFLRREKRHLNRQERASTFRYMDNGTKTVLWATSALQKDFAQQFETEFTATKEFGRQTPL